MKKWLSEISFLVIIITLVHTFFILPAKAAQTGTFTENFNSKNYLEERTSYAFWDTKNHQAVLPVNATTRDLSSGLQSFQKSPITAVATDGTSLMVGGAYGTLNLVNQNGGVQDLTASVPKSSKVAGIGYLSSRNLWVVGGSAKSGDGAMLYVVGSGGNSVFDLQAQAKKADLDQITAVACSSSGCLLLGTKGYGTQRVAFFDGTTVSNITGTPPFNTYSSWRVAASASDLLIAGVIQDTGSGAGEPYRIAVYRYRSGGWDTVASGTSFTSRQEPGMDLAWVGNNFLLVRRGTGADQPLRVWILQGGGFSDITPQFATIAHRYANQLFAGGDGRLYYLAGTMDWSPAVMVNVGGGIDLASGQIATLSGATVNAMVPYQGGIVLAGAGSSNSLLAQITLQGFVSSGALESRTLASVYGSAYFTKATLTIEGDTPSGTSIVYFLSSDGSHWEGVTPGREYEFRNPGKDLRFRAVLSSGDGLRSPVIHKIQISYVTDQTDTPDTLRSRDYQRIFNLKDVAYAIDQFRKDRGSYPIVDDPYANGRWSQLKQFLISGRYLTTFPQDPKYTADNDQHYDYVSSRSGSAYMLLARLEESGSSYLANDTDGQPVELTNSNYTCNDPWYCEGKGLTSNAVISPPVAPLPFSPLAPNLFPPPPLTGAQSPFRTPVTTVPPASTLPTPLAPTPIISTYRAPRPLVEFLQDDQGKVWRIATLADGEKQRLPIPTASLPSELQSSRQHLKKVSRSTIAAIPRVRLVKTSTDATIYYITTTGLKRAFTNWKVFLSYGNDLRKIMVIEPRELNSIPNVRLIRLIGDSRVWYLQNGLKRQVKNLEVIKSYGLRADQIAPVNAIEFSSYPEGPLLE